LKRPKNIFLDFLAALPKHASRMKIANAKI
jgi:hypothetical protein